MSVYLIVTKKSITIVEGIHAKQFSELNAFWKAVCWFLSLLCYFNHQYSIDTNMKQRFSKIEISPPRYKFKIERVSE